MVIFRVLAGTRVGFRVGSGTSRGFSFVALSKNFIVKTKSTVSCAVQQNGEDNNNVELAGISKKLTYGLDLSLQKL